MTDAARSEGTARADEERLAHALISRGLLTRDEFQSCRPGAGDAGPQALLTRLVAAGFLTAHQAERAGKELETLLGQQIPGYQLLEKLGQGAMGTVYKARQMSMNRLVAVKVLHSRLAANPEFLQRLTREAHLAARLSHNNIIQAIDVGSAGPLHYFVMELVEGRTIREILEAGKVYEEREAVEIILQIAQALQHAHRRGLIHRDVKPANIVLTTDGIAKLADLGMARETDDAVLARREKGVAMGTPYYMAPEQIRGRQNIDGRADLYALGATLYHLVTGKPPFLYPETDRVLMAHLEEELTPPDHLNQALSSGLGEVVEFLMAKDRRRRYRNADDLIIDLECILSGEAPKLARRQMQASTLAALGEGEAEEDEGSPAQSGPPYAWVWIAILGGLLALSFLVNLILLVRRSQ
ncbi:MAG TPA: serine/threonine-protein kinase [Gemmataceae bacterium]|nr:serine/threonine-protein kinase [Gemmataceae bacterium]